MESENTQGNIQAAANEAWRLLSGGKRDQAVKVFRWVLQRRPGEPAALAGLAFAEWRRNADNRTDETLRALRHAVDMLPEAANIRHAYVTVLSAAGEFDELAAQCQLLLQRDPADVGAFAQLANSRRYTEEDDTLRAMRKLADSGALTGEHLSVACIGLAKAYDDLGQYEAAIKYAFAGRAASVRAYDMASERADLAEIQRLAKGDGLSGIATSGVGSEAPIFIVGMPRSGTTLLETMLGRHPGVHAGGELHFVAQVENALLRWLREDRGYMGNRVAALRHVPAEIYRENANVILDHMAGHMAGRRFFTDKNPENAMRLGLISRLFPGARILYMRRHPLDSCISNLFVRFGRGMEYGSKVEWLGEHYRNLVGAMAGWREIAGLPVLDVSYENLVDDPEAGIRRVLDFLDLEFDEACLSPEQSDRIIRTASKFQARQPINKRSANRWKRYEPWLGPLVEALGGMEWIEREADEARAAG